MAKLKQQYEAEGFYGIGVHYAENETNIGTLWRSAYVLGAAFIFTIGRKYKKESSDVTKAWSKIPLYHYETFDEFRAQLPFATVMVGVEMAEGAIPIQEFDHPPRAVYVLGCESRGLPESVLSACQFVVSLPGSFSLNVAVAGSLVAYDRVAGKGGRLPKRR
ncbi:RNA methyltransferase [Phragmitibacter flavus]|nr:RNA methyltransferase [Phragmitibacter flavus]